MLHYFKFYVWLKKHLISSGVYISVLLLLSIAILSSVWVYSKNYYENLALEKFDLDVVENLHKIENRMLLYENVLRSGVGFFYGSNKITRQDWYNFIKALDIKTQYPGMQGVGFSLMIKPDEISQVEEKMRREGFASFSLYPKGEREQYSAIVCLEPINQRNLQAIGYDMYSEKKRREAMESARDTGLTSITGKVTLVQEIDSDVQNGMLMYLPIYEKGAKIDTIEERRKALDGFVYSAFRMNDMMDDIALTRAALHFEVYDNEDISQSHLLYKSFESSSYIPKFKTIKKFHINNRTLYIHFLSTPVFDALTDSKYPLLITFIGLIVNLFLIVIILLLIKSRQRIQEQAKKNEEQALYILHQSRLAQMGEMISMIAHQWRQPLASISAITGTLTLEIMMDEYNSRVFQERVDSINELTQHLSSTIDDFRGFFKKNKEQQLVNIEELISETLHIIGPSFETKKIQVQFGYKEEINIYTSSNEVKQVILNILKNAEDALTEKSHGDTKIVMSWYMRENNIYISIEDNAGGIPNQIIDTIFDPYFSTKQAKDGTGLGLYMSKIIVEEHCKGKLSVVNTAHGAKFIIKLPATLKKQVL